MRTTMWPIERVQPYEKNPRKLRAKDRPLENDFVRDEEFDRLLDAWFGNMARVLLPGRAAYIWGGYANCANYPPFLKKHGFALLDAAWYSGWCPPAARRAGHRQGVSSWESSTENYGGTPPDLRLLGRSLGADSGT